VRDEAAFRAFVETNGATLLHAARLLTGDHHRGEDLVQSALTKVYLKWDRIDTPLAYARRALVTGHVDATRRKWWGERPTEFLPEEPCHDALTESDERDELRRMLNELTPRERAVVVLRYYCDQSEQETAAALGMPLGTVKSTCARALAHLRIEARVAAGGEAE
jgi:RNA polymerase sigma-70 factor (sigma-E family)